METLFFVCQFEIPFADATVKGEGFKLKAAFCFHAFGAVTTPGALQALFYGIIE